MKNPKPGMPNLGFKGYLYHPETLLNAWPGSTTLETLAWPLSRDYLPYSEKPSLDFNLETTSK